MKILADENGLRNILFRGNPEKRIARVRILHEPTITPIHPYKYGNDFSAFLIFTTV
jgi:hypothetical protein